MRVRLAGPEDVADVARLLGAFRDWYGKSTPDHASFERSVRRILETENAEYLLAGTPAVGVAQVRYRWSVWTEAEDCWLEDLYVTDEARRGGIGRALAEAVLERARARGCKRVELDVDADNTAARALYASLGFRDKAAGGTLFLQLRLV